MSVLTKLWLGVKVILYFKTWLLFLRARVNPPRTDVIFELRNGIRIRGGWEPRDISNISEIFLYRAYVKHLNRPIAEVIDIGANVGYFSIFAAVQFPQARVLAYEPFLPSFNRLREHLELNNIRNVTAYNQAVSGATGTVRLYLGQTSGEHSVVLARDAERAFEVEAVSLFDVFTTNSVKQCDLLKMDCEGSEYDILYNFPAVHLDRLKYIAIETHMVDNKYKNHRALERYLVSHGFQVFSETIGVSPFLFATPVRSDMPRKAPRI